MYAFSFLKDGPILKFLLEILILSIVVTVLFFKNKNQYFEIHHQKFEYFFQQI